jgi:hypothetical protein
MWYLHYSRAHAIECSVMRLNSRHVSFVWKNFSLAGADPL